MQFSDWITLSAIVVQFLYAAYKFGILTDAVRSLDKRMDGFEKRLDGLELRFAQLEKRVGRLETQVAKLAVKIRYLARR